MSALISLYWGSRYYQCQLLENLNIKQLKYFNIGFDLAAFCVIYSGHIRVVDLFSTLNIINLLNCYVHIEILQVLGKFNLFIVTVLRRLVELTIIIETSCVAWGTCWSLLLILFVKCESKVWGSGIITSVRLRATVWYRINQARQIGPIINQPCIWLEHCFKCFSEYSGVYQTTFGRAIALRNC